MSMAYDVIFSVIAGLPKVYPNFLRKFFTVLLQRQIVRLSVPHSVAYFNNICLWRET